MFRELKWESLSDRYTYFNALMVFRCLNGLAPHYLQNKFSYVRDKQERSTRQSTAGLLAPLSNGNDLESLKYCFSYSKGSVFRVWPHGDRRLYRLGIKVDYGGMDERYAMNKTTQ